MCLDGIPYASDSSEKIYCTPDYHRYDVKMMSSKMSTNRNTLYLDQYIQVQMLLCMRTGPVLYFKLQWCIFSQTSVIEMALRNKAIHSPLMGINHSLTGRCSGTPTWPVVKGNIVLNQMVHFLFPESALRIISCINKKMVSIKTPSTLSGWPSHAEL